MQIYTSHLVLQIYTSAEKRSVILAYMQSVQKSNYLSYRVHICSYHVSQHLSPLQSVRALSLSHWML